MTAEGRALQHSNLSHISALPKCHFECVSITTSHGLVIEMGNLAKVRPAKSRFRQRHLERVPFERVFAPADRGNGGDHAALAAQHFVRNRDQLRIRGC